jgi:FkbM family methyltransferase
MSFLRDAALQFTPLRELYEHRNLLRDQNVDLAQRLHAAESRPETPQSVFFHYSTTFDPIETMKRHEVPGLRPTPGYLTNFLGVKIDPKFFPGILNERAGQVEGIPIPANWHADIAEWGVALRAIDLSADTFTMIELGCGWGCWMNNTGVAARRAGRKVHVIGVEGDEGHVAFARESLATNGFAEDQITLHRGIAAAASGFALFPKQDLAGMNWGLEAVFGATEQQRAEAVASGHYDELPMISLADLAVPHRRIDLLHIDIQGAEADFIDGCLDILGEKVAYILIGTHTKPIEGRLFETLVKTGWKLEMERPAIFDISSGAPSVRVDGVQGWRNPKLLPM